MKGEGKRSPRRGSPEPERRGEPFGEGKFDERLNIDGPLSEEPIAAQWLRPTQSRGAPVGKGEGLVSTTDTEDREARLTDPGKRIGTPLWPPKGPIWSEDDPHQVGSTLLSGSNA